MSNDQANETILRLPEVMAKTGLSRSTIYAYTDAGYFPSKVNVGVRAIGWRETEVNAWLKSLS